jgi:hypothetical protein
MEKVEFPTFLNEQPTIIFGRTGRELMIIAGGCTAGFSIWGNLPHLQATAGGMAVLITMISVVVILSLVVALVQVAGRPLEEWFFVLLFYIGMPKLFLYMPTEIELDLEEDAEKAEQEKKKQQQSNDPYGEEDES